MDTAPPGATAWNKARIEALSDAIFAIVQLPDAVIAGRRASGLSSLNEDQIAERGARMARRDDRAYREYVREQQRSQPGCPAREVVLDQRGQATRAASRRV